MALNLVRNSKVLFTTNLNSTNEVLKYGFNPSNTVELQVLEGFTFSQNTNSETVTINEAGSVPTRGQRAFNTSLAPVDFSFTTYIRNVSDVTGDLWLWNALFSDQNIYTESIPTTAYAFTGITYNSGTKNLTITAGSGLPTLTANTMIRLKDYTAGTATTTASSFEEFSYAKVLTSSGTSLSLELQDPQPLNASTGAAAAITSGTGTVKIGQVGINNWLSTGSNSINATYTYNSTTKSAEITINSSALATAIGTPTTPPIYLMSGVTSVSAGTVDYRYYNVPVKWISTTTNDVKFSVYNPPSTTASVTLTFSSGAYFSKSGLGGPNLTGLYSSTVDSDVHTLQPFGLLINVDNATYGIDNCVLTQATIDFGLDGISSVQWTGQGTSVTELSTTAKFDTGKLSNGVYGSYKVKSSSTIYSTNKLSSVKLTSVNDLKDTSDAIKITAGKEFAVPLTGGSITINNNVTFLTPAILGVVNEPTKYFTGSRSITGTMNAYLRTGASGAGTDTDTGLLLKNLLAVATNVVEPMFSLSIAIGGAENANTGVVKLLMPTTVISIPTVNVEQVITTAITFTAEGSKNGVFDLTVPNEITVRYLPA